MNNKTAKPQTLKGFRDFLPEQMRVRNFVLRTCQEVFESFGFEPLETPSLEYASTLLGKYGEDAERLVYTFKDRGEREVGLIYDLTIPVSRFLSEYGNQIPLPFKRYQIQRVWRAENPQKGRYREFLQCDVDTFGVKSPMADAEIIAIIYTVLKRLNFSKFSININSRQVLFKLLDELNIVDRKEQLTILRTIDKVDKKSVDEIRTELKEKGIGDEAIAKIFEKIENLQPDENLRQVIELAKNMGVDQKNLKFSPTLVRGLDYYTGTVFETIVDEPKIGSVTGGGRYDNLISQLGGPNIPAVGTTIGLDRICDVISELNLLPNIQESKNKVLVTVFSPEFLKESLQLVNDLRGKNINSEVYLDTTAKLDKQIKYADRKNVTSVIILGEEELQNNEVAIKNLKTGEQKKIKKEELAKFFS